MSEKEKVAAKAVKEKAPEKVETVKVKILAKQVEVSEMVLYRGWSGPMSKADAVKLESIDKVQIIGA